MKRLVLIFTAIILAISCFGCMPSEDNEKDFSELESLDAESNVIQEESEESIPDMTEFFEFLKSEYKVTSRREAFGTVYVCEYYFVDKTVSGAKLSTSFPSQESAKEYYDSISEDYPHAQLENTTVINFLEDDEDFYFGYSLEKLLFVLEKSGYEVTMSFHEAEFHGEISEQEEESVS